MKISFETAHNIFVFGCVVDNPQYDSNRFVGLIIGFLVIKFNF